MKKVFVVLMILMLPFSAMAAMTSISDNEMADVTGQVGISIAVVDFNMDMSIANFTYDDTDDGTIIASNRAVNYTDGFINIGPIKMENIYVTLAGTPIFAATPNGSQVAAAGFLPMSSTLWGAGTLGAVYHTIGSDLLEIDVMTADASNSNPYYGIRGKSGVLIGIPDMFISLDGIDIDGIYFDNKAGNDYIAPLFLPVAEKFKYINAYPKDDTKSIGSFHINGINITTYSYVAKTTVIAGLGDAISNFTSGAISSTTATNNYRSAYRLSGTAGSAPTPYYSGNIAYLLIAPH